MRGKVRTKARYKILGQDYYCHDQTVNYLIDWLHISLNECSRRRMRHFCSDALVKHRRSSSKPYVDLLSSSLDKLHLVIDFIFYTYKRILDDPL